MPLVAAKCTQCGANIEVDPNTEAGICKYCGTPFITEKAIVNFNTTVINHNQISANTVNIGTGNFDSFFKLGKSSWEAKDFKEAYAYFSKALEVDPNNIDAQIFRSLSTAWTSTGGNILLSAPDAAYSNIYLETESSRTPDEISNDVSLYLDVIGATRVLAEEVYNFESTTPENAYLVWSILRACIKSMRIAIKICEVYLTDEAQKGMYVIALQQYSEILIQITEKRQYDTQITGGLVDLKKIRCPDYSAYLEELENNNKKIKEIDPNASVPQKNTGGCYIATCVYGSYDCPQVWVLRRYRDDFLASSWYGRTFIRMYYTISPYLVKWFGKTKWFRTIWRSRLNRLVNSLQIRGFESTPYEDRDWKNKK